jgi:hypothetical protein
MRKGWLVSHSPVQVPCWRRHQLLNALCIPGLVFALTIDGVAASNSDSNDARYAHDTIVDDWYELIRYLVGLSLCIFGLIGLYFHQFASYHFVKKYTKPMETEHRVGRVLSCEPIVRGTCDERPKGKKRTNSKMKPSLSAMANCHIDCGTDYVREEEIRRHMKMLGTEYASADQSCAEYRMLVVYSVPKAHPNSFLCCHPIDPDLARTFTNSFSVASLAPDRREIDIERVELQVEELGRSRSLPPSGVEADGHNNDTNGVTGSEERDEDNTEYYQWFQTSTPRPVNAVVDLVLLKGQPRSACTRELIQSHLEQVGITGNEESEKEKYFKSLSLTGFTLVVAIIVLGLVCASEILQMPNPETQRTVGFTVLGGVFLGSIVGAYAFSKLMFEHYKNAVFLSSFSIPPRTRTRGTHIRDLSDELARQRIASQLEERVVT